MSHDELVAALTAMLGAVRALRAALDEPQSQAPNLRLIQGKQAGLRGTAASRRPQLRVLPTATTTGQTGGRDA